jgi:hypothetical protein
LLCFFPGFYEGRSKSKFTDARKNTKTSRKIRKKKYIVHEGYSYFST